MSELDKKIADALKNSPVRHADLAECIAIKSGTSVSEAMQVMGDNDIGSVLVTENKKL